MKVNYYLATSILLRKSKHKLLVLPGIEAKRCSSPRLLDRVRTELEESLRIDSPEVAVPSTSPPEIEVHNKKECRYFTHKDYTCFLRHVAFTLIDSFIRTVDDIWQVPLVRSKIVSTKMAMRDDLTSGILPKGPRGPSEISTLHPGWPSMKDLLHSTHSRHDLHQSRHRFRGRRRWRFAVTPY